MLKELYIENLAVIKKANISFSEKLNIFTGETGAGKSILINGINAVIGQRTSKDIVRAGCDKAVIIALFTDISDKTCELLKLYGFDCENNQVTFCREIYADGGSVARINSRVTTVSILKEIGQTLINIHGQHDNQILLSPEKHIDILDSYGEIQDVLKDYQNDFKQLQETARKINKIVHNAKEKEIKWNEIKDFIDEISPLNLTYDEDIAIEEEFKKYQNSTFILEKLYSVVACLSGNEDDIGIVGKLDNCQSDIDSVMDFLNESEGLSERIKNTDIELQDISSEIEHLISQFNIDSQRFEYVEQRRDTILSLKHKYSLELNDIIDKYNEDKELLNSYDNSDILLAKLTEEKQKLLNSVTHKAKKLSETRNNIAMTFIDKVTHELAFLDMPNVKFEISHNTGKLTINGMDNMEFLISTNLGENPKPVAKIASGGELSRIMLAFKTVLAKNDSIPTLIFDEIDTGVSGRAAQKIGIKLSQIADFRQVLCVTHLAQIAVMADEHLCIEKNTVDNKTETHIDILDNEKRKYEIARIMGGNSITELLLKNAEELIKTSKGVDIK